MARATRTGLEPSHRVELSVTIESSSSPASKAGIRATILLVDDDPFQAHLRRAALKSQYASVERVADASEAFIRVEEPGFQPGLALVVVGLSLPGVAGPAFVDELMARVSRVPILVIGRPGEKAADYNGKNVQFLPAGASRSELLAAARRVLARGLRNVA
jgi:DNA-binding response OmpR family regulator